MKLHEALKNEKEILEVIDWFNQQSRNGAEDIISAYNLLADLHTRTIKPTKGNPIEEVNMDSLQHCIHMAAVICSYMEPEIKDIIAILLFRDYMNGRVSLRVARDTFKKEWADSYYNWLNAALKNSENNDALPRENRVEFYIMMRVCDSMFNSMMRDLNSNRVPNAILITKAYNMAKKAHYWVTRASGEPYMTHPVRVSKILSEMGVESEIIAAALLHDVVEDTDLTKEDVAKRCDSKVADYVDAVTSLDKQYRESTNMEEYALDKDSIDKKTFEKLAGIVYSDPSMVFALYIKAADRIDNLRTMDSMPRDKSFSKNDETELEYRPLFEEFNLHYFVDIIDDLTWRNSDVVRYTQFKDKYSELVNRNSVLIEDTKNLLTAYLGNEFNRSYAALADIPGYTSTVTVSYYTPFQVYSFIRNAVGSKIITERYIDKEIIPVCDMDIVLEPRNERCTLDTFINLFAKMFRERISNSSAEYTIVDFDSEETNDPSPAHRAIFYIEDKYNNTYRCRFCMKDDFYTFKLGSNRGVNYVREKSTRDTKEESTSDIIHVYLRNGKEIELPKGATALDVAFYIHSEVGLAAIDVEINGQKELSIKTILHEGDRVTIHTDTTRENGVTTHFVERAKINWLLSVRTKYARNKLVDYFCRKYEPDDSRKMNDAADSVVATASDGILERADISAFLDTCKD